MKKAVIVSAVRTPIGSFGGALASLSAVDLGAIVIKEAVKRAGIDPKDVSEVIMGQIYQAGQGQGPARQAAIKAGLPYEVPSMSINKLCGSGLKAVNLAASSIILGETDIVVAGGMESMSNTPYLLDNARFGYRMGDGKIIDSMINDGLTCAINKYHMGITAENLAEKYNITREEQDEFAVMSQQKAIKAIKEGKFKDEIVPVEIPQKKGDPLVFDTDEYPKDGVSLDKLSKLKAAFKKEGTVTAGNASGINDGAAALVLMSEEKAHELGIKPMAYIHSYSSAAVDPAYMGIGPVPATKKALLKGNLKIEDIELIEANEAFAAQSLSVVKELGLNKEIVNVNGGAIALGHPVGASGARILVTLLYEMEKRGTKTGLATLCVGGGHGVATIVTRQ